MPHLFPVRDAGRELGIGLTKTYELVAEGRLEAVKIGTRTLITGESIERYIASLPRAKIVYAGKGTREGEASEARPDRAKSSRKNTPRSTKAATA